MDKLLLSIPMTVNGEAEIVESPALLVELDLQKVLDMIQRVEKVKSLREDDDAIFSLSRHGFSVGTEVYDRGKVDLDDVDLWDECSVELTEQQYRLIEEAMEPNGDDAAIRVDCRQEHYIDDGVYFTACMKHSGIKFESQGLGLDTLQGYRDRLLPAKK